MWHGVAQTVHPHGDSEPISRLGLHVRGTCNRSSEKTINPTYAGPPHGNGHVVCDHRVWRHPYGRLEREVSHCNQVMVLESILLVYHLQRVTVVLSELPRPYSESGLVVLVRLPGRQCAKMESEPDILARFHRWDSVLCRPRLCCRGSVCFAAIFASICVRFPGLDPDGTSHRLAQKRHDTTAFPRQLVYSAMLCTFPRSGKHENDIELLIMSAAAAASSARGYLSLRSLATAPAFLVPMGGSKRLRTVSIIFENQNMLSIVRMRFESR